MTIPPAELDRMLDRLVDGELSSTEYRQLLASLDEQPAQWRRCALAFVQAQALGSELRLLREEGMESPPPKPANLSAPSAPIASTGWTTLRGLAYPLMLAMAAGFMLALVFAPRILPPHGTIDSSKLAVEAPAQNDPLPREASLPTPENSAQEPLGNVRLVMDGEDGRALNVPVYHADQAAELLGPDGVATLSPEMLRSLENAGNQVVREQSVLPFELEDGGRLLVPIDRYRITPVNSRQTQ
ncbi:MAG TPA: hypothetical protein VL096_07465 [Pirellulaceae bacterium]|nr:hypothetical protein [Pirellulaceae bacterium]